MFSLYIWRVFLWDVDYRILLCITQRVIKMSDKKTKIDCKLSVFGTAKADAKVAQDMNIPDPGLAVGKQLIKNAIEDDEKDVDDGDQQDSSR